jgi:hypothetical protein
MVAVIRGWRTASGKRFDIRALTAAHRSLPFGAVVLVENLANGRTIELRITDRGPYVQGRIIGLLAAAQRLGLAAGRRAGRAHHFVAGIAEPARLRPLTCWACSIPCPCRPADGCWSASRSWHYGPRR